MGRIKLIPWDSARYLETEEDIAMYMEAVMGEAGDDPAFVAHALGIIARARNMSQLARDAGMTREGLYKALSGEGNPSFSTVSKVAGALGLRMRFEPVHRGVASKAAKASARLAAVRKAAKRGNVSASTTRRGRKPRASMGRLQSD